MPSVVTIWAERCGTGPWFDDASCLASIAIGTLKCDSIVSQLSKMSWCVVRMQSIERVHRRDVLKGMIVSLGLAGALVFTAWPKVATPAMGLAEIRRHVRGALAAIVDEGLTPKTIGRRYLTLYPEEADIDHLWTALTGLSAPSHSDELSVRLAKLRQQDFEDGEVAIVDGWILARTEARACALLTLA